MGKLNQVPTIDCKVSITLDEAEMRALDALVGYGADPFLKVFYEHLGKHYMRPHEKGLRSLFDTIRSELPPILRRADHARQAFALQNPVIRSREDHDALIARCEAQAVERSKAIAPLVPQPLTDSEVDDLARTMVKGGKSVNWLIREVMRICGIEAWKKGSR